MLRKLTPFVLIAAALIVNSHVSAQTLPNPIDLQPKPTLTVKNMTPNRWAYVTLEVDYISRWAPPSHFVKVTSFCLKNGESKTMENRANFFRLKVQLRKLADCATPNVIETLDSKAYPSVYGPSFQPKHRDINPEVLIEGKYSYTLRYVTKYGEL